MYWIMEFENHENDVTCNPTQMCNFWNFQKQKPANWEMATGAFWTEFTKSCWLQAENKIQ